MRTRQRRRSAALATPLQSEGRRLEFCRDRVESGTKVRADRRQHTNDDDGNQRTGEPILDRGCPSSFLERPLNPSNIGFSSSCSRAQSSSPRTSKTAKPLNPQMGCFVADRGSSARPRMAHSGYDDQFPPPRLSVHFGFGEASFAK